MNEILPDMTTNVMSLDVSAIPKINFYKKQPQISNFIRLIMSVHMYFVRGFCVRDRMVVLYHIIVL